MPRYRVKKTLEAVIEGESEGEAVNTFISMLQEGRGDELGMEVKFPLYSIAIVDG